MYDASCMRAYMNIVQDGLEKKQKSYTRVSAVSTSLGFERDPDLRSAGGRLAGVMNIKPWTSLRFYTVYTAVARRVRGPGAGGRGGNIKY